MILVAPTSEERSIITDFMRLEIKIITILAKLSNFETHNAKNSERYMELTNDLKVALDSEKKAIEGIKKRKGCLAILMQSFKACEELLNLDEGIVILHFRMISYVYFRINQLLFSSVAEDTPINRDVDILFNMDKLIYADFLANSKNPRLKYKLAFANHAFCDDFVQVNFNIGLLCPEVETGFLSDIPQYEEKRNAYLIKRFIRLVGFTAANDLKDLDTYLTLILGVKKLMPQELVDMSLYELVNSPSIPEQRLNEICAMLERKEKEQNQIKSLD